jgi:hypothetical protein
MTINKVANNQSTMNQTLLPASERLKTVNLTKSSTENSTTNTALYSVGASTKEVCWLPVYTVNAVGEQVVL